ncbi:MAG: GH116 family glycosyl hydrolase, partial [Chloroflexota bacterium]|nr:GH116 family glycosyl hydrolase [Chloroflexota bacterium]
MSKATFFTEEELFTTDRPLIYKDEQLREIAFPLGGLGTGCVSLSGRGGLRDWEIFNRPNKASILPYTFFTLWAKMEGQAPVTRVVQAPPTPPFSGQGNGDYRGFGFGVTREDGSGLPHMRTATFRGEFPFAEVAFDAPDLPVGISLEAYSPFIPLNPDDSGVPIAVLRYHVHNDSQKPVKVSLVGNLFNPIGYGGHGLFVGEHLGQNLNTYVDEGDVRGLYLTSDKYARDDPAYGSMALTTTWEDVFHQDCWLRSGWFDAMHDFWNHFSITGTLPERDYGLSEEGESDVGSLGLRVTLEPGEAAILPFYITWYFPNFVKYWPGRGGTAPHDTPPPTWKNYYASQWDDALDVARYYATEKERLYRDTRHFHDALFDSTLPSHVLDALSSQTSILHSPTVLRLEDGTFYGWEGCHSHSGSCEGSCTHVWNYAQTLAFLFPSLERSMREADYEYNMRENGEMCFRLQLPPGSPLWDFHPAADGQMGGILKLYRDWRLCGDDDWLRELWPKAKKALEYAWEQWDADKDGVMEGIQHNTYDIEFHGPNTMMGSFYLGALRAGETIARYLGDEETADTYHQIYENGRRWMDRELYNGEYYVQKVNDEGVKYQYGRGCLSDQLIGQWFAHLVGLGHLFDTEQVRSAIKAVFEHNWQTDFWKHANPQRIYALNDEQGLLLCTWPNGGRPEFPFVYSDEVWCGIEYQVASHLIYEGFVKEGLAIVKGLRARHDGLRRNPWNEFECGSHYARSLASWSLLTALSGYHFDVPHGTLGFAPRWRADDWRSFWSTGTGWG